MTPLGGARSTQTNAYQTNLGRVRIHDVEASPHQFSNPLVTSTLTVRTEPYPSTTMQNTVESEEGNQAPQAHPSKIENDVEAMISDGDEELANAQADEDNKHTDMDATEKTMGQNIAETSETSPEPTTISDPSEAAPSIEKLNPARS